MFPTYKAVDLWLMQKIVNMRLNGKSESDVIRWSGAMARNKGISAARHNDLLGFSYRMQQTEGGRFISNLNDELERRTAKGRAKDTQYYTRREQERQQGTKPWTAKERAAFHTLPSGGSPPVIININTPKRAKTRPSWWQDEDWMQRVLRARDAKREWRWNYFKRTGR